MAEKTRQPAVREHVFLYEGKNRDGKIMRGEMRAATETIVIAALRRQGVLAPKIKKQAFKSGKKITDKDITVFTRQLSTMMRAGVPLLQAFDIVGRGHGNPSVGRLIMDIKADVEAGSSLAAAFKKHPLYFDDLFCNLVEAGEQGGILEALLDRLAIYKEKILSIKSKIKSALIYPVAIIVVAFVITAILMIFVIPAFKGVFESFGADLPAPTLVVIAISDFFVAWWWAIFGVVGGSVYAFLYFWKHSKPFQNTMDRLLLRAPIFGDLVRKSTIARWTRTLSTMFAAGVPLVEALESVGGASGNHVYLTATQRIQQEVSTGLSLTNAMNNSGLFPSMVIQMVAIGEESGALDSMLSKVADFFEAEVDDAVAAISSLMEPAIMIVLGVLIGGLVVAMYMPIFKLGQAV